MFKKKQPVIAEPDTMNGDIFLSIAVAFLAIIAVNVVIKLVQFLKRTFASKVLKTIMLPPSLLALPLLTSFSRV